MKRILVIIAAMLLIINGCSGDKATEANPESLTKTVLTEIDQHEALQNQTTSNTCQQGILDGVWVRNGLAGADGTFTGLWYSENGNIDKYYDGTFWTTEDNMRLFYGTLSGYETDDVQGFMFGIWYYDDPRLCPLCGTGHGHFRGYFTYQNAPDVAGFGVVQGEFGYADDVLQDTLPMTGNWRWQCFETDDDLN